MNNWTQLAIMSTGRELEHPTLDVGFNFFKAVGKVASGAVSVAATVVTAPIKATAEVVKHVPVVGKPIASVSNTIATGVSAPLVATSQIIQGRNVGKATLDVFKKQLDVAQAVAPYAQTVVSFVPGIGQGVSGVIGTAAALSEGKPITEALVEGVKGALPGGPLAAAALDVAMAAAQGKPIDTVALNALPIPKSQKDLIIQGAAVVKDVVKGRNVGKAVLDHSSDAALKAVMVKLPKNIRDAATVGFTMGGAKQIQDKIKIDLPNTLKKLKKAGSEASKKDPVLKAGVVRMKNQYLTGFKVGVGVSKHITSPAEFKILRARLTPDQRVGFDTALSTHIGRITHPAKKRVTPERAFLHYTAVGMKSAKKKDQREIQRAVKLSSGKDVVLPPDWTLVEKLKYAISNMTLKDLFI